MKKFLLYAACFLTAFLLRAGYAQLYPPPKPPVVGVLVQPGGKLQSAPPPAVSPKMEQEEYLVEAVRAVRILASMGFNWNPAAAEEARFNLRDLTAAQVAEILRAYDSEDPAMDAVFYIGMTELAEKDYELAIAELAKRPGSKYHRLETFVLKGLAKNDPHRALAEAAKVPPAFREAALKACYFGWRDVDAPAAWGHLMAMENPNKTLVAQAAAGMAAIKPEIVGDYLTKLTKEGAELPDGMLEQCLHMASLGGGELTGRLLQSLPESLRGEALQALAGTGCARDLPALLKEIGELKPGEKEKITTAWASGHQAMALKMVQEGTEDSLLLLAGILSRPHDDGAAKEAWALVPEANQAGLVTPMARTLAVLDVPDAVAWSATLGADLKAKATVEIVKWGFGRNNDAVFSTLNALPDGPEKTGAMAALGEAWGRTEPNSAANWMLKQTNPDHVNSGLAKVLPRWAAMDAVGLAEWVAGAQLPPETMETVLAPLIKKDVRFAEAVKARKESHETGN